MTFKNTRLPAVNPEFFALFLGLYFTVFLNGPLWAIFGQAFQAAGHTASHAAVFAAFSSVIGLFQVAFISLLMWGRMSKPVGLVLVIIATLTHYFASRFGVLYDPPMIRNVFATDVREASELMNGALIQSVVLWAAVPVLLMVFVPIKRQSITAILFKKLFIVSASLIIGGAILALNYKPLSSIVRQQSQMRHAVLPVSPLISALRAYTARIHPAYAGPKTLIEPAPVRHSLPGQRPLLVVVVAGETLRAQNWGLSGYARQTTPQLAALAHTGIFNAPYAASCGTSTEVSLPCMFSLYGRHHYDENKIHRTESVLGLINRAGITTTWVENQSGCKGVCDQVKSYSSGALIPRQTGDSAKNEWDARLVDAFDHLRPQDSPTSQLLVLHMLGNHGPAYYRRYPPEFERFTPACRDDNFINCTPQAIHNAYDNAALYTDNILVQLINRLSALKTHDVALLYASDHGESLGEAGLYLHGIPYSIAPDVQTHVPFMLWMPPQTQERLGIDGACLKATFANPLDHDHIAHSLLGLFGIETSAYEAPYDLFHGCRKKGQRS
jgi:lipid A ethanolaminephosphotransferase